ncbi:MAG: Translation initiation factor IF-2, partial [Parcubacteria group bacterium GW2011_GWA2_33_14]
DLLDMILLVADMQEFEEDLQSPCEGLVIESYMDSLKGPIATLIIEKGILNAKDIIATNSSLARIKSLQNFKGEIIDKAYPAQPVVVLGFEKVPGVGEKFKSYTTTDIANNHIKIEDQKRSINNTVINVEPDQKVLNIILKGDVFGSIEAIEGMLKSLPQDRIILRILKVEVGDINETDVKLAEMSKALIIGFRVKIMPAVSMLRR